MKINHAACPVLFAGLLLSLLFSCKKEDNSHGTVTDIDGNIYQFATIGTKDWMGDNLETKKYNDGTSIPNVISNSDWAALSTPGCCWYTNSDGSYGVLYNWYAVNTGKLAPKGWHVATDAEWITLTNYFGGTKPMRIKTGEEGFPISPFGTRSPNGEYNSGLYNGGHISDFFGHWWTSTEYDTSSAWYRYMGFDDNNISTDSGSKRYGFTVRCVRN